jgi:hypothetical protein
LFSKRVNLPVVGKRAALCMSSGMVNFVVVGIFIMNKFHIPSGVIARRDVKMVYGRFKILFILALNSALKSAVSGGLPLAEPNFPRALADGFLIVSGSLLLLSLTFLNASASNANLESVCGELEEVAVAAGLTLSDGVGVELATGLTRVSDGAGGAGGTAFACVLAEAVSCAESVVLAALSTKDIIAVELVGARGAAIATGSSFFSSIGAGVAPTVLATGELIGELRFTFASEFVDDVAAEVGLVTVFAM